ncbi:MAG: hypothetical protein NT128_00050, partial [Proteobacteria bacterium]|nr:hypothetical protein [Pseudomonadota bacterium]
PSYNVRGSVKGLCDDAIESLLSSGDVYFRLNYENKTLDSNLRMRGGGNYNKNGKYINSGFDNFLLFIGGSGGALSAISFPIYRGSGDFSAYMCFAVTGCFGSCAMAFYEARRTKAAIAFKKIDPDGPTSEIFVGLKDLAANAASNLKDMSQKIEN